MNTSAGPRSYLSLTSKPFMGGTRPVFVDGPTGQAGLDVNEPLYRLDANVHLPTRERGVSSANRVGEPLATLQMEWRTVGDAMRAGSSQAFAMQSGTITFRGDGRSTLRFAGTGRTFPAVTDGQARLLFAGSAVISEGTGRLKGAGGVLMITGEIFQSSTVSLSVVGRLSAGSPVPAEDELSPLADVTPDAPATVLTLLGSVNDEGVEQLRVARIGNDLSGGSLRSLVRVGSVVGRAHQRADKAIVLTFTDPSGVEVGNITAVNLEGTNVALGPATHGCGALAGAGGVLMRERGEGKGAASSPLYVLRLADPKGRFRPPYSDVYKPVPAAVAVDAPPDPAPADSLAFVDGPAGYMSAADVEILRYAERSLSDGMELAAWWEAKDASRNYAEPFQVVSEPKEGNRSLGFFDTASVANASMPVMGVVQERFYDRQKMARPEAIRDQLKEFVLRYFMRVSHLGERDAPRASPHANGNGNGARRGPVGYQQLYYKRRDSSKVGKFVGEERWAIADLRTIAATYDWIILKVDVADFILSFAPFGAAAPRMQMPLAESTYLVLGPPFIRNEDDPEPGVLGHYGFSFAFVPYTPGGPGVIAYAPGHFAAAIQQIDFKIMDDGEIRVRAGYVVHRPRRIAHVDIDPIDWGFKLADLMTFGGASRVLSPVKEVAGTLPLRLSGLDPISTYFWMANAITNGMAGRRLGHSKAVIEKQLLAQHFLQHHALLTNSLVVWRMVADWQDKDSLPAFLRETA